MDQILDEEFTNKKAVFKLNRVTLIIWSALFAFGIVFKILHWPGSSILEIIGASGFIAYNIYGLIRFKGKNALNNTLTAIAAIWISYIAIGLIFNDGHPLNGYGLTIHVIVFVVIFGIYELVRRIKKKKE